MDSVELFSGSLQNAPVGNAGVMEVSDSVCNETAKSSPLSVSGEGVERTVPTYAPARTPEPMNSARRFAISSFLYQRE